MDARTWNNYRHRKGKSFSSFTADFERAEAAESRLNVEMLLTVQRARRQILQAMPVDCSIARRARTTPTTAAANSAECEVRIVSMKTRFRTLVVNAIK